MKPSYLLGVVGAAALVVAIVGGLFLAPDVTKTESAKPVAVRYMTNAQLATELAPVTQRFRGPNVLQVPQGYRCYTAETQAYKRVVIVCVA